MVTGIVISSAIDEPVREFDTAAPDAIATAVGGLMEAVDLLDLGITIYVNEEGLLQSLPYNPSATLFANRFVAEGYTHTYDHTDDNGQPIKVEEFVAKKIGHDLARTRYDVDRPRRAQETDSLDTGLEDATLSHDTPRRTSAGVGSVGR